MARFSVYRNPNEEGYLMDVQADLMAHLNTRLVVPLVPLSKAPKPARTLNPVFTLEDVEHAMLTQYAAAIPAGELKREIANLSSRRDEIVAALDLLLQGF
ncbi:MAG: CcdB family protein [Acetobacteraceae bacterium]|nr:CcdB family protein [Acetobacteraceae bacterium]